MSDNLFVFDASARCYMMCSNPFNVVELIGTGRIRKAECSSRWLWKVILFMAQVAEFHGVLVYELVPQIGKDSPSAELVSRTDEVSPIKGETLQSRLQAYRSGITIAITGWSQVNGFGETRVQDCLFEIPDALVLSCRQICLSIHMRAFGCTVIPVFPIDEWTWWYWENSNFIPPS